MTVRSWMMLSVPWPCSISPVAPMWGGHRKTAWLGRRGMQERARRAWQEQSCCPSWGASKLCVGCLLLHPFSPVVPESHGRPQGCTSRQDLQTPCMYAVVSLECLWKAPSNESATAHQARPAYTFPVISVSLPPKHSPAGRVGAGAAHPATAPGISALARSWQPWSSSPCLTASAVQGVYLGRLPAPRDEEIVRLTMLIQGARNFSPCLGFSCPRDRKSTRILSAEDWPEALGSDIPAPSSGSSSPVKGSAVPGGTQH